MALLSVTCLAIELISFSVSVSAAEPIRIGAIFGLTNLMAPVSEENVQSLKLALEEFLPREIGGRWIEVIFEDSALKPDLTLQKAKKLA